MSRSKRFISGLLTGYVAIGVNILYTIATIPLAFQYLNKEEFGIWALTTQLSGYLALLEFGMTGSIARSLSDHKDDLTTSIYGSIIRTGTRVFAIQGLFVILLGLAAAYLGPQLLKLPDHLHTTFTNLMGIQAILCGAKLSTAALGAPLWSHQRLDLSNLISGFALVISFITLWVGFHYGWHLYSLAIATATGSTVTILITFISCRYLNLYAPRAYSGKYSSKLFRELFKFGSGLFIMNLGAQLTSASQVIVISRLLGVEIAAVWVVSTKLFNMSQQFVSKVLDTSAAGLSEIYSRGESLNLLQRYRDITIISAILAVSAGAGIALINGPFVEIWTHGKITWSPWNNYFLGCLLFSTAVSRCHVGLVGISKQIHGMKFINLAEGIIFVTTSILVARLYGITGILCSAITCNILITGYYSIGRTAKQFELTKNEVLRWAIRPAAIMLSIFGLFLILSQPIIAERHSIVKISVAIGTYMVIVLPVIWLFGISTSLKQELQLLIKKALKKEKPSDQKA